MMAKVSQKQDCGIALQRRAMINIQNLHSRLESILEASQLTFSFENLKWIDNGDETIATSSCRRRGFV
jgi:hypothetical protein